MDDKGGELVKPEPRELVNQATVDLEVESLKEKKPKTKKREVEKTFGTEELLPDLERPQKREVINLAVADLESKPTGRMRKIGEDLSEKVVEPVKETKQNVSNEVKKFIISRRAFFQWLKVAVISGGIIAIATWAYIKREGIIGAMETFGDKFTVVEEKPVDPRIIETYGKDYSAWASGQAQGQYGLYLMGNEDKGFNITNIPTPGDKDNIVWLLTYQYKAIWPFVTPERDGEVLDQDLYPLASKESFVNRIADDLDLNDQQRIDLLRRWKSLSVDPQAAAAWLEDLKSQGVKSVTDDMIKFYSDPISFVTETNQ